MSSVPDDDYRLCFREHAGAVDLLRGLGAFDEIEAAILTHCRASAPAAPLYEPEAIKGYLKATGWAPVPSAHAGAS